MNNMDAFLLITAGLFLALSAFLVGRLLSITRGARRLTDAVADIQKTGFIQRVHLGFFGEPLAKLGTELNMLMDEFQDIIEEKRRLELSHK